MITDGLRRKIAAYSAANKPAITVKTADLATILAAHDDSNTALQRLVDAARAVANLGFIEHNAFIVSTNLGRELRAALKAYEQATGNAEDKES